MEEFMQLVREVSADSSISPTYDELTSACLYSDNTYPLLDDSSTGTVFPTGENLPPISPYSPRRDFTENESDAISLAMSGTITITACDNDMTPELSLDITESDLLQPILKTEHTPFPPLADTLLSTRQMDGGGREGPPLLGAYVAQSQVKPGFVQRPLDEPLLLDNLPDFGSPLSTPLSPNFPFGSVKVEHQLMPFSSAPDVCLEDVGSVSVSVIPPSIDKKKMSTCKVVGEKVFVRLNKSFWLEFRGSFEALMDTEICLEVSYVEPDSRDTSVEACRMHWENHVKTCSTNHQGQSTFLCTGGLVPIQNKYANIRSYTSLKDIIVNKLKRVDPILWAFNLKLTALCWNSCHPHKDNGKNVALTVSLQSRTNMGPSVCQEFGLTCCESPTRDCKPPSMKRRRCSSPTTEHIPVSSCLMSPWSQSSSPASSSSEEASSLEKNFSVMVSRLSSEGARRVRDLLANNGVSCSVMETRGDF